jgi:hypothetical protein
MEPTNRVRPMGVTILAVLAAIGGVLGLLAGVALMGFGGLAAGSGFLTGSFLTIFGLVAIAQAVALLAFAYGAWTLQPWGWILCVAAIVVGLVMNALFILNGSEIASQIVSIALSAAILYYLFTPAVKQAFGRA